VARKTWSSDSIDGDTRVVAIIADPVAQVKSPQLFNAYFERHGINAVLIPAHVEPQNLKTALDGFKTLRNLAGVVVTVPHKIAVAKHISHLSPLSRAISSVNCLRINAEGEWEGDNFDGIGFLKGLSVQGHAIAGRKVLLVGASGGAGVTLSHALAQSGVASLALHDIRMNALSALVANLRACYPEVVIETAAPVAGAQHDLVINASPLGMHPDDPCPIDISGARPDAVIADLIMKPERTRLLMTAEESGLQVHGGRHLLENAVAQMVRYLGLQN
jgi:shikimate dehydrogenase